MAPTALSVSATADTTDTLSVGWTAPVNTGRPALSGYDVEWKLESADDSAYSATGVTRTGTAAEIDGLTAGTEYSVRVRAVNDEGDGAWATAMGSTDAPAVNTAATGAPTISGTARVGLPLRAAPGTIADANGLTGVSYTYQWVRVGTDLTETDITGANSVTYTPVAGDLGSSLKVRLSFDDDDGHSESRTSAATGAVAAAASVLVSNLGQTSSGRATTGEVTNAQQFTAGTDAAGYVLAGVAVDVKRESYTSSQVLAELWSASSGVPGTKLATLVTPALSASSSGTVTFGAPEGTELTASTDYFLVFSCAAGHSGDCLRMILTPSDSEDTGGAAGFSIGNQSHWRRTAGWSTAPNAVKIRISGDIKTSANNAPTFTDGATTTRSIAEDTGGTAGAVRTVGMPVAATDADTGDMLTYSVTGGTDQAAFNSSFTLNSMTGQISTKSGVLLSHETKNSWAVTLGVSDGNSGTDSIAVTVSLTDVVEKPVAPAAPSVSAKAGTSDTLSVSWSAPVNTGRPAISGYVVQWKTGAQVYGSSRQKSVTGTSTDIGSLTANTSYSVRVRAVNDEGDGAWSADGTSSTQPANSAATGVPTISGTAQAGQSLSAVTTPIMDADGLTGVTYRYQWVRVVSGSDDVNVGTAGSYTVADADVGHKLKVVVSFTDGRGYSETRTSAETAVVTAAAVPNSAPTFAGSTTAYEVAENTTTVATLTASDDDAADSVTGYTLSGADASKFQITSGGVLTFSTAPDHESPTDAVSTTPANAAGNNEYIVTVTASSGAGGRAMTADRTLTVTVTDVAEPPLAPTALSVSAKAGTSNTLSVSWTAPVNTGRPALSGYDVEWKLSTAADADYATTGVTHTDIAVTAEIGSLEADTEYSVRVRAANDEGNSAYATANGSTDPVNSAPTFAGSTTAYSVAENTTTVATLTASDADAGDTVTGYTLSGADASKFQITSGGVLTFSAAPDHENPTDAVSSNPANVAGNNEYIVTVTASSGAGARVLTADRTLTITVNDAVERPATPAPTVSASTLTTLTVTWPAPASGVPAGTTPPPVTAYHVTYREGTSGDYTTFTHGTTARSATITGLKPNTTYQLRVQAQNDEGFSGHGTVSGTTVADSPPAFASSTTAYDVTEHTTSVATLTASDPDTGHSITGYALSGADAAKFAITSTGGLSFKAEPDHENPTDAASTTPANAARNNEYVVTVTVSSGPGGQTQRLTASITLVVTVEDAVEAPGVPVPTITEAKWNKLTVMWTEPDNDGPPISGYGVQYREGDSGSFTPWTHVGTTRSATITGLSPNTAYQVQVRATNAEDSSAWSASVSGTTPQNVAPAFSGSTTAYEIDENETTVATLSASDADTADSITKWSLSGADKSAFSITSSGGLSFRAAPDYERPADAASTTPANAARNNVYVVTVTITGGAGDRARTAARTLTVTVRDDNTEAPGTPAPRISRTAETSLTVVWREPENKGPEITDYDVQYREGDSGAFTPWPHTGTAREATITGLTKGTSYQIQVQATNAEGSSGYSASVTGVPSDQPGFTLDTTSLAVCEDGTTCDRSATFTIVLDKQPTADVTVRTGTSRHIAVSPTSITFTATNWNTPRQVTVTAVQDDIAYGQRTATMHLPTSTRAPEYRRLRPAPVKVAITDDDTAGVEVDLDPGTPGIQTTRTVDEDQQIAYTIRLTSEPTYQMRMYASATGGVTVSPPSDLAGSATRLITFSPHNWDIPKRVTVYPGGSLRIDDERQAVISHTVPDDGGYNRAAGYTGVTVPDMTLTVRDVSRERVAFHAFGEPLRMFEGEIWNYNLGLTIVPTQTLTVTLASSAPSVATIDTDPYTPGNQTTITFHPQDFRTAWVSLPGGRKAWASPLDDRLGLVYVHAHSAGTANITITGVTGDPYYTGAPRGGGYQQIIVEAWPDGVTGQSDGQGQAHGEDGGDGTLGPDDGSQDGVQGDGGDPVPTPVTACTTHLGVLAAQAQYAGSWDGAGCAAHHEAESQARYFSFTLTQQTTVTVTLSAGTLYVSKGTPSNGWGTVPKATYEHRINVRRANGALVHDGAPTATLSLPAGSYTAEAVGTGDFTISIAPP